MGMLEVSDARSQLEARGRGGAHAERGILARAVDWAKHETKNPGLEWLEAKLKAAEEDLKAKKEKYGEK